MSKCLECGKGLTQTEGKRAKLYCNDGCRKRHKRTLAKADTITGQPYPDIVVSNLPANFGQPDCECRHCRAKRTNKSKNIINHGPYKTAAQLAKNEVNRVSLPGDVDYAGVCNSPDYDDRRITA